MKRRWLLPLVGAALFFTVGEWHWLLAVPIGVFMLLSLMYALAGMEHARNDHFVHGHKEGDLVPTDYRVVATARQEPSEHPWPKPRFGSPDDPKQLTRWVSGQLGPAVLQHAGLVLYRESEEEARGAEAELHALLDPIFPEPVQTRVERWNEDLRAWQRPERFGGDKATASALRWEARVELADKSAAREAAERLREAGELWVAVCGRRVAVATTDESAARMLALTHPDLARATVRRLNPLTRRWFLHWLYDTRQPSGGWLEYDEPAAA